MEAHTQREMRALVENVQRLLDGTLKLLDYTEMAFDASRVAEFRRSLQQITEQVEANNRKAHQLALQTGMIRYQGPERRRNERRVGQERRFFGGLPREYQQHHPADADDR